MHEGLDVDQFPVRASDALGRPEAGSCCVLSGGQGLARSFMSQSANSNRTTDRVDPVATCDSRIAGPRPVGVALFQNLSNHLLPKCRIGLRQRLPMPPVVIGREVPVIENEAIRDIV